MNYLPRAATPATDAVRGARDFLLHNVYDYEKVIREFRWPELDEFNFALEWFDVVAGEHRVEAVANAGERQVMLGVVPRRRGDDGRGAIEFAQRRDQFQRAGFQRQSIA